MLLAVALASSVPGQRCSAQSLQMVDETQTIERFDAVNGGSITQELGVPAQPSIPGEGPYFTNGGRLLVSRFQTSVPFLSSPLHPTLFGTVCSLLSHSDGE